MKFWKTGAVLASLLIVGGVATAQMMGSPQAQSGSRWHGMMNPWHMGRGWRGQGPMPRHHIARMWGIPAPYTSMTNPLPRTQATLEKGAAVYAANCAACHGEEGRGDGEAGRDLSPPPGNLAWLSSMPMAQWDAFIYWTIAEGGAQFGTAMPAYKDSLSSDEIWAVTAYIQAHLPHEE